MLSEKHCISNQPFKTKLDSQFLEKVSHIWGCLQRSGCREGNKRCKMSSVSQHCESSLVATHLCENSTKSIFAKPFSFFLNPKKLDNFLVGGPNSSDISEWMKIGCWQRRLAKEKGWMKDKERINHCKHRYTACGQETIVVVMVVVVVEEPNLVERQRNDYPLLT